MSLFLLDTTVLIDHMRGDPTVAARLSSWLDEGHDLAVSCVNIAELEAGLLPRERDHAARLLGLMTFLPTDPQAAIAAGAYQAQLRAQGVTLNTADALVAGTARRHGAALVTANTRDFPMDDIQVLDPHA